jgi:hypoxanthine phosphoribosyltransferase
MDLDEFHFTWHDIEGLVGLLSFQLQKSGWLPTMIVGLTRGGLTPAVMLSHKLNVPMTALDVQFRDYHKLSTGPITSWLPETINDGQRFLIVDDINDTGQTFSWIQNDWMTTLYGLDLSGKTLPSDGVKFAVLLHNRVSSMPSDFYAAELDKLKDPRWIVFPWEKNI